MNSIDMGSDAMVGIGNIGVENLQNRTTSGGETAVVGVENFETSYPGEGVDGLMQRLRNFSMRPFPANVKNEAPRHRQRRAGRRIVLEIS
jgi:hypothetical protein